MSMVDCRSLSVYALTALLLSLASACADTESKPDNTSDAGDVQSDRGDAGNNDTTPDVTPDTPDTPGDICAEDSFEGNDTAATALAINEGVTNNLRSCPGDEDFYAINASAGQELTVAAAFTNAEGNLDLELIGPDSSVVESSTTAGDGEQVSHVVETSGRFVIRVFMAGDAGSTLGNGYRLTVTLEGGGDCAEDPFEDNDSAETAAGVDEGTFDGLRACPGDLDFYSITLSTNEEVTINAAFSSGEGAIEIDLIDGDGTVVASSTASGTGAGLAHTVAEAGTFTIEVRLETDAGSATGNGYDLQIAVVPGETSCDDDTSEENDSPEDAAPVDEGTFEGLAVCPSDDDFYTIVLSAGEEITIDLAFAQADGDLDLGLIDPNEELVAESTSEDDDEQIVYTALEAGTYLIWVNFFEDFGDEGASYDMTIAVEPSNSTCVDDAIEENDSEDQAASVSDGEFADLRMCELDDDFYAVVLNAGDEITVDLTFSHAEGDIDVALVDPDGNLVASSEGVEDNETISYTADLAGTYLLVVFLIEDTGEDEGNGYDMTITIEAGTSTCDDDLLEDNDSPETAEPISEGLHEGLRSCDLDADFYSLLLSEGDEITVRLDFTHAEGDLDLGLLNPDGDLVAVSADSIDDEEVVHVAEVAGTYVIWVDFYEDLGSTEGNDYDLEITVEPAVSTCDDDTFEENDSIDAASPITEGNLGGLRMCNDADYYDILLSVGDEITVDVLFDHDEGDIDLGLFGPDGAQVAGSAGTVDDEQVAHVAAIAGTYTIEVVLFEDLGSAEGNDYGLNVTIEPAVSTCEDDGLEENDSVDGAVEILAGSYPGLRMCAADDDFYSIVLSAGDEITVDLGFTHAEGDIDLLLYDPEELLVASSLSVEDDEQVVHTAAMAGTYIIWVDFYEDLGDEGTDYDLDVTVVPAETTCEDDFFEDNDSDVEPAEIAEGAFEGLRMCDLDDDWFVLSLSAGDEVEIGALFTHAEGDIDLGVFGPDGTLVVASEGTVDDETVSFTATTAGEYLVLVLLWSDLGSAEGNDYDLVVDVVPAVSTCDEDPFEDNDSELDPAPVEAGNLDALRMCDLDDDYYAIVLAAGDELTVGIGFDDDEGDIDLELIDPDGFTVDSSSSVGDFETVSFTADLAGEYLIRVFLWADDGTAEGNDYTMDITVVSAEPMCVDDRLEDNDSAADPTPVTAGSFPDLRSCGGDDDFYEVVLGAGDEITVDLAFSDASGDVDVLLRDSADVIVGFSTGVTDSEQIVYTSELGGTYTIEVYLAFDDSTAGNDYDLDITIVEPVSTCSDDDFENNDSASQAELIEEGIYEGLRMCELDSDFFDVVLGAGDELTVLVEFTHAEGDIDVELTDAEGDSVGLATGTDDDEEIVFTAVEPGTYTIEVLLFGDLGSLTGNDYDLTIAIESPNASCTDDDSEDNDSIEQALDVEEGSLEDLRSCTDDGDFYAIPLSTGDTITIDVDFVHAQGDVDLVLWGPEGAPVASSTGAADDEQIVHTATAAGVYTIEVFLFGETDGTEGNDYDLQIDVEPAASTCAEDDYEDNDSLSDPTLAVEGVEEGLRACGDDAADIFAIDLLEGDVLLVDVLFDHAEGDIDVWLWDPDFSFVTSSESSDDDEAIDFEAPADGRYYVDIFLYEDFGDSEGNTYSLELSIE